MLGPPELAEARIWYTKAAEAGHIDACVRLGLLLATRLDRPELAEARIWYTKAAEAGHTTPSTASECCWPSWTRRSWPTPAPG